MTTFVTSDLHFGHKNILKYNPATRPWSDVREMNEALVDNWNSVVEENDTVYNLGDLAMMRVDKVKPFLSRLNGNHILIRGNHDKAFYKESVCDEFIAEGLLTAVHDYKEIRHNHQKVVMSHYAMRVWNCSHHGAFMLYGHSHGSLPGLGRSMDVGIDACDMESHQKPFRLDDVIAFLSSKDPVVVDHHNKRS